MPNTYPPKSDSYEGNYYQSYASPFGSSNNERHQQLLMTAQAKRKFSFPATLHSSALLEQYHQQSTRRRLSNVSDAVTRKLSYTIGWKSQQISAQDIITQGCCLCGQYIKRRLRRSGLFNKKLGLQRIRSIMRVTTTTVVREVFPAVLVLGDELERMHPRVYNGIARQICRNPGGEFQSVDTVNLLLSAVARDLFRLNITWSKIVSLFAIAGGLSADCVRQGHSEYLPKLMESVSDIIEDELVPWINENGGWLGMNNHVLPATKKLKPLEWSTIVICGIFGLFVLYVIVKFFLTFIIPELYQRIMGK
ncbi:bcl-2-related ovarian killer protein isoform X2 [Glossina fuscipes]|nr:bcl-2-related ovarian killer protein isoform X2 [Glossina fuscipes]